SGSGTQAPGIDIQQGTGVEVGWNEGIGCNYPAWSDNMSVIRCYEMSDTRIHHNVLHGSHGQPTTGSGEGIQLYSSHNIVVEDNYLYDNQIGIYEKQSVLAGQPDGSNQNIYRRNWMTNNVITAFTGSSQGPLGTSYVYDNVIDGLFQLGTLDQ